MLVLVVDLYCFETEVCDPIVRRLDEMKRGYVEIMKQRNAVELQYHLLRTSGRPLYGTSREMVCPIPSHSMSKFMLPSTSPGPHNPYASSVLPAEIRTLQQRSCEHAASPDIPCLREPPHLREKPPMPSPHFPTGIPPEPSQEVSSSLIDRNELRSALQMQVAPQTSRRPQVDPAVLFEKTGMDMAVEQLRDNAHRMHMQSRELGRTIQKQHERFETETFLRKNADPLLNDINSEQQAFIREQLRCIDEVGTLVEILLQPNECIENEKSVCVSCIPRPGKELLKERLKLGELNSKAEIYFTMQRILTSRLSAHCNR